MNVFVLEHEREFDGCDDIKRIGVYGSRPEAERAKERAVRLLGFIDHADGFSISEYELGRDHWTSGFVTVGSSGDRVSNLEDDSRAA